MLVFFLFFWAEEKDVTLLLLAGLRLGGLDGRAVEELPGEKVCMCYIIPVNG